MKKCLLPLMFLVFQACCPSSKEEKKNFDWLVGEWERANEEEGRSTFENWKKENDSTYVGFGFTLKGQDTVWYENTIFATRDGMWKLQVSLKDSEASVDFKATNFDENSFVVENPENDFPKVITYKKEGEKLIAEISDADMKIGYDFVKKQSVKP